MKGKLKFLIVVLTVISLLISVTAVAQQELKVKIDGEFVEFDVKPIIKNNRALVPARKVFEKLGAEVKWDQKTQTAWIKKEYMSIEITVGKDEIYIHRNFDFTGIPQKVELDVPAMIINGRLLVPVRVVAEGLGANILWDQDNYTVIIESEMIIIPVETPASYKIISSEEIKDNSELIKWYENNRNTKGVHYTIDNDEVYILVCGGERNTGGYSVEIDEITLVNPETAYVSAHINIPDSDMMVIQVITYPHVLVKLESKDVKNVQGEINDSLNKGNGELEIKL